MSVLIAGKKVSITSIQKVKTGVRFQKTVNIGGNTSMKSVLIEIDQSKLRSGNTYHMGDDGEQYMLTIWREGHLLNLEQILWCPA